MKVSMGYQIWIKTVLKHSLKFRYVIFWLRYFSFIAASTFNESQICLHTLLKMVEIEPKKYSFLSPFCLPEMVWNLKHSVDYVATLVLKFFSPRLFFLCGNGASRAAPSTVAHLILGGTRNLFTLRPQNWSFGNFFSELLLASSSQARSHNQKLAHCFMR